MKQYSPIQCANPDCKKEFVPARKNKFFCTPKCQTTFSNGLSDEERKTRALTREVKKNDLILATILRDCSLMDGNLSKISKQIFELRKLKFEYYRRMEEIKNEEPIYWMDIFGLQATNGQREFFALYLPKPKSSTNRKV